MLNNFNGNGNLVKKYEIRYTQSNKAVINFTIAIRKDFKNTEGKYDSDFIKCTAWGGTAELIDKYVSKGDLIGISGKLESTTYEKDGEKIYSMQVNVNGIDFLRQNAQKNENTVQNGVENHKESENIVQNEKQVSAVFKDFGENMVIEDNDLPF